MKKNLLYSMIVCMAALFVFSSCVPDKVEGPLRIKITSDVPGTGSRAPKGGGDITLAVVVNPGSQWLLTSDSSWITFTIAEGDETTIIPGSIQPNTTGAKRTAILTATTDGVPPYEYKITQLTTD